MTILVIFLMLAVIGSAYAVLLTTTAYGRTLNREFPAFLTALGMIPVVLATMYLGAVDALTLTGLLVCIGGPFVLRGTWRIVAQAIERERGAALVRQYERQND